MKYKVLKTITRRAEGMKVYSKGDIIELTEKEGAALAESGLIAKEQKLERKTKEHKPKSKRSK
jgi:hypothetical protein